MPIHMKALIIVDVQNDFLPGGNLAVASGDEVISVINRLIPAFDQVIATQDFHPAGHGSFASSHKGHKPGEVIDLNGLDQILWPDHCVQGTEGAAFHKDLQLPERSKVFQKGTDPGIDSYSGFFDNGHRKSTGLADYLRGQGIKDLYITGLAADYCVKFTVLDALKEGFNTTLITDATRGVNLQPEDTANALREVEEAGASLSTSEAIIS